MPPSGYRTATEVEIKKSRFITTLARTDTEAGARALIAEVRAAHPEARHHATAYVIDDGGVRLTRSSDDQEPAGTAGAPMLNALTRAECTNVTAVVTRYFGGIKLGTGGLTRAYGGCVAQAVALAPRVVKEVRQVWAVEAPHAEAGRVQDELLRSGGALMDAEYGDQSVRLTWVFAADPTSLLSRVTQGSLTATRVGEVTVEVPVLTFDN